jgi:hypothetical protein
MTKYYCFLLLCFCFHIDKVHGSRIEKKTYTQKKQSAYAPLSDTIKTVKWYLDAGLGGVAYKGDLSGYEKWGGMFHMGLQNDSKKRFSPRLEAFYGIVSGQNSLYSFEGGTPNKFFQTHIFGITANVQVNLLKNEHFRAYLSQGLGIAGLQIYDKNGTDFANLPKTRAIGESYSNTILLLPTAIGGSVFFQNRCGINLEIAMLNTMTDYIDNISKWGTDSGNDNLLRVKFSFFAPIVWQKTIK